MLMNPWQDLFNCRLPLVIHTEGNCIFWEITSYAKLLSEG